MTPACPVGAVVVAGGAARRFGGVDKLLVEVDGVAVLARVLAAVSSVGVDDAVVVGPRRPGVDDGWRVVREDPPGTGPAAAVAVGLAALSATLPAAPHPPGYTGTGAVVLVLAGDLPHLTGPALQALLGHLAADPTADAVVARDAGGRRQHLLAAWRRASLVAALAALGDPVGRPVAALGDGRRVVVVDLPTPAGGAPAWQDLDVPPGSAPPAGS